MNQGGDQYKKQPLQNRQNHHCNGKSNIYPMNVYIYIYNIGFSQLWTCIYFGDFPANHLWWHWSMVSLVAWELIWFPESGLLGRRSQSQIIPGAELQKHQGWSFKNQNHLGHSIYMKVITVDGCEILHQWIGGLSHYMGLTIQGGAGFLPSTVRKHMDYQEPTWWTFWEKKTSRYLFTWRSILVRFVSITVRYTICVVPFVARMIPNLSYQPVS